MPNKVTAYENGSSNTVDNWWYRERDELAHLSVGLGFIFIATFLILLHLLLDLGRFHQGSGNRTMIETVGARSGGQE